VTLDRFGSKYRQNREGSAAEEFEVGVEFAMPQVRKLIDARGVTIAWVRWTCTNSLASSTASLADLSANRPLQRYRQ
jgi:hypothetical protein